MKGRVLRISLISFEVCLYCCHLSTHQKIFLVNHYLWSSWDAGAGASFPALLGYVGVAVGVCVRYCNTFHLQHQIKFDKIYMQSFRVSILFIFVRPTFFLMQFLFCLLKSFEFNRKVTKKKKTMYSKNIKLN